jgi:chitinase
MALVQKSVDYVNLMTYDFRGDWEPTAGHHSNLYPSPTDPRQRSADGAVREFLAAGVPSRKLVLGVPFYGRAWEHVNPEGDGLYRVGQKPLQRVETGYAALAALTAQPGWVRRWDAPAQAPFLWNAEKRVFVTYDDPESLRIKARYVRERGLGGVMFWEYNADTTGALLEALSSELRANRKRGRGGS